jgi:glycosyltransferase involved in cell wall biosynthesis
MSRRLRIGIDNVSPGQATGLQAPGSLRTYMQSLLAEFDAQAPEHEYVLFTPAWADPVLEPMPASVRTVSLPGVPANRPLRIVYQQTGLAAAASRENLDVFLATATIAPLLLPAPVVLTVHFLRFQTYEGRAVSGRSVYLRLMLILSLRKARAAITFTEFARADLARYTGVSVERIHVVPHGLRPQFQPTVAGSGAGDDGAGLRLTGGRPYILCPSAINTHKNHIRLIRAFGQLKRQSGLPHVLLLVGAEINMSYQSLRAEAERAGVGQDLVIAGRLEHEMLPPLYQGASLVAMPSLYETFGFPVAEAMATGCPLLTSNLGAMAELAGDAAVLVDPLDEAAIADGMLRALTDQALRQTLTARGLKRAEALTWQRTAAQTLAVLESAARPGSYAHPVSKS